MKILTIHADYLKFKPVKIAIKEAEKAENKEIKVNECLVVFTAVEKDDEKNQEIILDNLVNEIKSIASKVKTKNIVLYPYAHLSSKLSSPNFALETLKEAEKKLKKHFKVTRAPFGHYKSFEISCKGHPLSELSREILAETKGLEKIDKPLEIQIKDFTKLDKLRNTFNLFLGKAVADLFPNVKPALNYLDEDKFYYDFERNNSFTVEDIKKIENKMHEILEKEITIKKVASKDQALLFKDNNYKKEIIKEIKKTKVYEIDNYKDLIIGEIEEKIPKYAQFKLLTTSGVYWKGSQYNKQLQRVYGIAFENKNQLDNYLKNLEEIEKREHRKLGEQLGLYFFHEYSPGSPIFLPKGTFIYNELIKLLREEYKKRGYKDVITPLLYEKDLWETSGHWFHYKENMFLMESEKRIFSLKPMNCPSHCLIYKHKLWSYKELPLRIADFAPLHRNELSGTLSGLTRVRKFSQDDAHIFVSEDQFEAEVEAFLEFQKFVYEKVFNFEYHMYLATRPEEFMGEVKLWDEAEAALERVLKEKKLPYTLVPKDCAFYGPKIDLRIKDSLGREWQLGTVQLDFQLPLRFELTYEAADGKKRTPIMIHRAVLGSLERFIGILIEHFAGKLPVWLSPVQVVIMTVADRHVSFAEELKKEFDGSGLRVEIDARIESIGKKE